MHDRQTVGLHARRRLCAGMGCALWMRCSIRLRYYVTTAVGSGDRIIQSLNGHYATRGMLCMAISNMNALLLLLF